MSDIKKPMNPFAKEDFNNAIKSLTERLNEQMDEIRDRFEGISFMNLDPIYEPYCGKVKLAYMKNGAWEDFVNILLFNGYEVTMKLHNASEVEREVDGIEKFIIVEFEEVA